MTTHDVVTLTHLVGFLTGIALYTMLVVMTSRGRAGFGGPRGRVDGLPFATAVVGLTWNVGALFLYALRDLDIADPPILAAIAFSALGLLPALIVHSALTPEAGRWRRPLVVAAYALSATAAAINIGSAAMSNAVSRDGLLLLSIGFVAILGLIAIAMRGRTDARRSVTIVALAAFTVSALHLSTAHSEAREYLPLALVGHHASIPLALVILYQDYRFALIDTVLRRTLSFVALVATASVLYVALVAPLLASVATSGARAVAEPALSIGLVVATALVYPILRGWTSQFVDRVLLRRGDYGVLRRNLAERLSAFDATSDVLDAAALALSDVLGTRVAWGESIVLVREAEVVLDGPHGSSVRVPTNDAPAFQLDVAPLDGGRRLLSDDVSLLESVAGIVGRRIDAVRVTSERVARDLREQQTLRFAAEAELRALRAQLQPHFLFNALTTVAHLVREAPDRAVDTLYRLTGLLRSMLRTPLPDLVPLSEEVDLIEAYLAIERARFEERLCVEIAVTPDAGRVVIPPLLLQPLVENAVKHGIAPLAGGGRVRVTASIEREANGPEPPGNAALVVSVEDDGMGIAMHDLARRRIDRVGLTSVETRLRRAYGDAATFSLECAPSRGVRVTLRIPLAHD